MRSVVQEARTAARHAGEQKRRCFQLAEQAFAGGDRALSARYSEEGHTWRRQENEERRLAKNRIFAKK